VQLLLLHGAHADRADKHGVTPEVLAQQNGWIECAQVLRDWIVNKDRDLREREGYGVKAGTNPGHPTQSSLEVNSSSSPRRRLHVKQSIDIALNLLKSPDVNSKTTLSNKTSTPPASPMKPFGEYTFHQNNSGSNLPVTCGSRRPSLPHVLQPQSDDVNRGRKFSTTSASSSAPPRPRRPRSVGSDNEDDPDRQQEQVHPVYGRGGSGRKLGSKYSLLNLFKKAHPGEGAGENGDSQNGSTSALTLSRTDSRAEQLSNNDASEHTVSMSTPSILSAVTSRVTSKVHRGSDASQKGRPTALTPSYPSSGLPPLPRKPSGNLQTPPRTNVPLAVELHMALAHQQAQNRDRSNSSSRIDDEGDRVKPSSPLARLNSKLLNGNRNRSASSGSMPIPGPEDGLVSSPSLNPESDIGKPSPSYRPGILKAHNRTNSNGQGSPIIPRTLRFDSTSSDANTERKGSTRDSPRPAPVPLRSYNSAGSLGKLKIEKDTEDIAEKPQVECDVRSQDSQPSIQSLSREQGVDGEVEEENYGQLVTDDATEGSSDFPSILLQRQRGNSFASSSESSLSPILSNDVTDSPPMSVLKAEFPFSINRPPSFTEEPAEGIISSPDHLNVPILSDSRGRGDSLSSNSTSDSRHHILLASSGSVPNVTVASPRMSENYLLQSDHIEPTTIKKVDLSIDADAANKTHSGSLPIPTPNERRAHSPLDIDITSISSHAQAEALVERARQEALDFANTQDASPPSGGLGRSPLSARLAAYGESLALERKLREQKGDSLSRDGTLSPTLTSKSRDVSNDFMTMHSPPRQKSRDGVERQLSLENKAGSPRRRKRPRDPRRPSTADGRKCFVLYVDEYIILSDFIYKVSSSKPDTFFPGRTASHQSSHSTSGSSQSPELLKANNTDQLTSGVHRIPTPQPSSNRELSLDVVSANTPIIPSSEDSLCRVDSSDAVDTETDSIPTSSTHKPVPQSLSKREQVRSSAKKLTKMGIPVADQAAAAGRTVPIISSTPPPKRFGLRSIMQTFKNKA